MGCSFTITRPPSVNSYYANNKSGKGRGRYITNQGNVWRRVAMTELQSQKAKPFSGACAVTLSVPETNRRADIDNLLKPTLDLLVKAGVLPDDNSAVVKEVRGRWVPADTPCTVEVEPFKPPKYEHPSNRSNAIIAAVAGAYGVGTEDILGPRRHAHITTARAAACYWIREKLGYSYPKIGGIFKRDHSTIISAVRRHEARLEADRALSEYEHGSFGA